VFVACSERHHNSIESTCWLNMRLTVCFGYLLTWVGLVSILPAMRGTGGCCACKLSATDQRTASPLE
jgi:hypothetical protein